MTEMKIDFDFGHTDELPRLNDFQLGQCEFEEERCGTNQGSLQRAETYCGASSHKAKSQGLPRGTNRSSRSVNF